MCFERETAHKEQKFPRPSRDGRISTCDLPIMHSILHLLARLQLVVIGSPVHVALCAATAPSSRSPRRSPTAAAQRPNRLLGTGDRLAIHFV